MMEQLTPIDEEPAEDLCDEDEPITLIPKIVKTAPSPSNENAPSGNWINCIMSSNFIDWFRIYLKSVLEMDTTPNGRERASNKDSDKEISQIESVL